MNDIYLSLAQIHSVVDILEVSLREEDWELVKEAIDILQTPSSGFDEFIDSEDSNSGNMDY